jgi:SAM-dependent methyltransferase
MELAAHQAEHRLEQTHWWFVARRKLLGSLLKRSSLDPAKHRVLDVGTGTGGNMRMLREIGFEDAIGVDLSVNALRFNRQKGLRHPVCSDILMLPFAESTFDVVLTTDILEHIEDDAQAINSITRVLKPGGIVIATVPAFSFLWGSQDNISHHVRRYSRNEFLALTNTPTLRRETFFFFNFILFFPILFLRLVIKGLGKDQLRENTINTGILNALLTKLFELDIAIAQRVPIPFGVSMLTVLRKVKTLEC